MIQYTPQQLEERYQKLPPPLKDAVLSPDTADKIFEIGKKNGLSIEQIGILAEETGRIILGLTRPGEFAGSLKERLSVSDAVSQALAADINHEILFPLREILQATHQVEIKDSQVSVGGAPSPQNITQIKEKAPEFMKGLKREAERKR